MSASRELAFCNGVVMNQHQLEQIGAKKLFDTWEHEKKCWTQDNAVPMVPEQEWDDLSDAEKGVYVKMYNAVAGEIGKIFREEHNHEMADVAEKAKRETSKILKDREKIKDRLAKIRGELEALVGETEDQVRAQAAYKFLKAVYRVDSFVDAKDINIQDILFGTLDSPGFLKWYDRD